MSVKEIPLFHLLPYDPAREVNATTITGALVNSAPIDGRIVTDGMHDGHVAVLPTIGSLRQILETSGQPGLITFQKQVIKAKDLVPDTDLVNFTRDLISLSNEHAELNSVDVVIVTPVPINIILEGMIHNNIDAMIGRYANNQSGQNETIREGLMSFIEYLPSDSDRTLYGVSALIEKAAESADVELLASLAAQLKTEYGQVPPLTIFELQKTVENAENSIPKNTPDGIEGRMLKALATISALAKST